MVRPRRPDRRTLAGSSSGAVAAVGRPYRAVPDAHEPLRGGRRLLRVRSAVVPGSWGRVAVTTAGSVSGRPRKGAPRTGGPCRPPARSRCGRWRGSRRHRRSSRTRAPLPAREDSPREARPAPRSARSRSAAGQVGPDLGDEGSDSGRRGGEPVGSRTRRLKVYRGGSIYREAISSTISDTRLRMAKSISPSTATPSGNLGG